MYIWLLIARFVKKKKISTISNLFKKAIYKKRYKYFRSDIIYVQNWRVCELLKCILAIQKQLTIASNNKSDRPQVKICDTWKTLKYLNINDSFHLKDLEISKYKRESKGRWPIKICRFISVNCYKYKLDTLLLKQMNFPVLDITGFFLPSPEYKCGKRNSSPEYECGKRNSLYPIRANSFVSIIMYLTCTIIVLLQKYMVWHIFLHF